MPTNQEHVHLAWPLWSDLRVIPTYGKFGSLVRPLTIFAHSCLVDLNQMTTTVVNNSLFRTFFEKQKLTGINFMEWYRNLQIVLYVKDKFPFLEQPIPALPVPAEGQVLPMNVLNTHTEGQEYDGFVQNYNMHSMGKTVTELHAMLKLHEQTLPPKEFALALHAIRAGRIKKKSHKAATGNQGKGKAKMGYAHMPAPPFAPKPKNPPTPKKDNPAKDAICHQCGEVGIFTIELYSFPSTSWVYDTGCGTHICITTEGLRASRKLKPGALSLGIISVSRLYKDGFVNRFENDNSISVSRNSLIYFNAIPRDDIYEIVLSSSNTNDSSMYAVSNKRAKLNLDSTLLWHCRLGHINKKRIEKLQHDGLLDSTDIESFEVCCLYVCRYGYVYLLKHKHEVFETFKVFQKEVENQLRKTIKLLRSDRGGEYMSQEFLNHLKDHRIIAHRTPPYTPQNNGVSERINQTLLDMVRSMMSQTTLPKSFWDYALESAARILNMVPTKKVDKTPYEV
ncbi:retrotransposon protein, putative, ty1-copia subclass [Tanacetum coccineum]